MPVAAARASTSANQPTNPVDLRRRGTRWNVFGITTHEQFELDGGLTHFLEGRMDASFGTTPLAMIKAIRLMETRLVDPEKMNEFEAYLKEEKQEVSEWLDERE